MWISKKEYDEMLCTIFDTGNMRKQLEARVTCLKEKVEALNIEQKNQQDFKMSAVDFKALIQRSDLSIEKQGTVKDKTGQFEYSPPSKLVSIRSGKTVEELEKRIIELRKENEYLQRTRTLNEGRIVITGDNIRVESTESSSLY